MNRQELLQNAKPILFNTEMVKAILNGKKSCTRRIIKPQPPRTGMYFDGLIPLNQAPKEGNAIFRRNQNDGFCVWKPPYQVDDILWVRETFFKEDCTPSCEGQSNANECPFMRIGNYCYGYKEQYAGVAADLKWRPSIHMPKDAARIFLKVTAVKVERLQDITPNQVDAEGFKEYGYSATTGELMPSTPVWFSIGWDSTVKKADIDHYGWKANPWVWVIEFERVEENE